MCTLVRASEASGTMGDAAKKLAEYLVSQRETTKKVKGALIYPGFMMAMSIAVTLFLLTAVLPKFTAIFARPEGGAADADTAGADGGVAFADGGISTGGWWAWERWFWAAGSTDVLLRTETGQRTGDWLKAARADIWVQTDVPQAVSVAGALDDGDDDFVWGADAGLPGDRE